MHMHFKSRVPMEIFSYSVYCWDSLSAPASRLYLTEKHRLCSTCPHAHKHGHFSARATGTTVPTDNNKKTQKTSKSIGSWSRFQCCVLCAMKSSRKVPATKEAKPNTGFYPDRFWVAMQFCFDSIYIKLIYGLLLINIMVEQASERASARARPVHSGSL